MLLWCSNMTFFQVAERKAVRVIQEKIQGRSFICIYILMSKLINQHNFHLHIAANIKVKNTKNSY